jgi:hypothetical protein
MKYTPFSLLLLTLGSGSALAAQSDIAHLCAMLHEFDCSLVSQAIPAQQQRAYAGTEETVTRNDASIKALEDKSNALRDEDQQFSAAAYQKACDMVLTKNPFLSECNVISTHTVEDTDPVQLDDMQWGNSRLNEYRTIELRVLSPAIEAIRQENVQHHQQMLDAIKVNDAEEKTLKKSNSEAYDQRNTQLREMRASVITYRNTSLRKLAHLNEDDYIIPWFPCSAHTPHGQATRCFSSSHHLYGITAFVSVSEQSNQMAAVYFPVGDGEVEDAYNNSQSDHAARWMADSADMHGDPVQAQRMREHIGVMSFTLAGVGNNPHIFMNQDKR